MDTSKLGRNIIPAIKEIGIPRVTQKAMRRWRTSHSRTLTNIKPKAIFFNNSSRRLFNILDMSL